MTIKTTIQKTAALLSLIAIAAPAYAVDRFTPVDTWDWQLTAPTNFNVAIKVLDAHPDLMTPTAMASLKKRGVRAICYVSVGTIEDTSPDLASFPKVVIGKRYAEWPQERFLDVRNLKLLLPLMKARFESCKKQGFGSIEPDNMDVYVNDSGFAITQAQTLTYVKALADTAHKLGLAIGQKNVPEMTKSLIASMDFAVTESCYQDGWCADMAPYIRANKAVFDAEYNDLPLDFTKACLAAKTQRLSMIVKDRDLTKKLKMCPK